MSGEPHSNDKHQPLDASPHTKELETKDADDARTAGSSGMSAVERRRTNRSSGSLAEQQNESIEIEFGDGIKASRRNQISEKQAADSQRPFENSKDSIPLPHPVKPLERVYPFPSPILHQETLRVVEKNLVGDKLDGDFALQKTQLIALANVRIVNQREREQFRKDMASFEETFPKDQQSHNKGGPQLMPIDLTQTTITQPSSAEVRYMPDKPQLIAKDRPPLPPKGPPTRVNTGLEAHFKPYTTLVIDGHKLGVAPLRTMKLPGQWWRYLPSTLGQPEGYSYNFSPKGDKETTICLERTGVVNDPSSYNQLLKTLEAAPHKLGEDEARALTDKRTKYQSLRSADCNGKRVIIGETAMTDKTPVYELIYDSYPTFYGRATISFYAAQDKYKKYIGSVKACFKTIQWETASTEPHPLKVAP